MPKAVSSLDIASIVNITRETGGDLHYWDNFDIQIHYEQLHYKIFRALSRPSISEASFTARCSKGFKISEYFGNFKSKPGDKNISVS
jgi:protein transport protein SEC24